MSYLKRLLFVLLFVFLLIGKSYASDDLKNYILKFLVLENYPYHLVDDDYHAYLKSEGMPPMYLNKDSLRIMLEEQKILISNFEVNNLKILSRSDTKHFTSVTFEYDWKAKMGGVNITGKTFNHSIMEKTETGWIVVFDAMSQ